MKTATAASCTKQELKMVLNKTSPLPDGVEHMVTTRKCHSTRSEVLNIKPL
jgi:hypothetical protein